MAACRLERKRGKVPESKLLWGFLISFIPTFNWVVAYLLTARRHSFPDIALRLCLDCATSDTLDCFDDFLGHVWYSKSYPIFDGFVSHTCFAIRTSLMSIAETSLSNLSENLPYSA